MLEFFYLHFAQSSSDLADALIEAQPLWEYPGRALTQPLPVLTIDFGQFMTAKAQNTKLAFAEIGQCNGIALWVDWRLIDSDSPKYTVSTGPTTPIQIGQFIQWDFHTRQGVHLLLRPKAVQKDSVLKCQSTFEPAAGNLAFKFDFI